MTMADMLASEDVLLLHDVPDKRQLIRQLATRAAARAGVDAEALVGELLRREDLGSTGVGGGIALPHARLPGVHRPGGVLAVLNPPIDYDAVDGRPVDIVFVLVLPNSDEALQALAKVARALREPGVAEHIRQARSATQLLEAVTGAA